MADEAATQTAETTQTAEQAAAAAEAETTQAQQTQAATQTATQTAAAGAVDTGLKRDPGTGQFVSWRSFVTKDDLKKHAERFNSLDDLVKGHADLRTTLSSAIIKPGKDAKPEDTAAYYKALGVPETADGYKALGIPDTADGYKYQPSPEWAAAYADPQTQERVKEFAKFAHENQISAEKFPKLIDWYNNLKASDAQAAIDADKKFADDSDAENKKMWGPDHQRNVEFSNRGAETLFGDDFQTARTIKTSDGRFILDHPVVVRALSKAGRMMSEDGLGPVPMSDADRTGLRAQLETLVEQQAEARMNGKDNEAKRIEGEIQKMASRISGDREYKGPDLT